MKIQQLKKNISKDDIENFGNELGFVEGQIRYYFYNAIQNYKLNTTNDAYIYFDDMMGIDKYVIYCNYATLIRDRLPSAISRILIDGNVINFRNQNQSPSDPEPYFSVKAEYFSLYSLGKVDWEEINILRIVQEIEKIESKSES